MLFIISGLCAWMSGWTMARDRYRTISPANEYHASAVAPTIREDSEQSFREGVELGFDLERSSPGRYTLEEIINMASTASAKEHHQHTGDSDGARTEPIPIPVPDSIADAEHDLLVVLKNRDKELLQSAFMEGAVKAVGIERYRTNYIEINDIAIMAYKTSGTKDLVDRLHP